MISASAQTQNNIGFRISLAPEILGFLPGSLPGFYLGFYQIFSQVENDSPWGWGWPLSHAFLHTRFFAIVFCVLFHFFLIEFTQIEYHT